MARIVYAYIYIKTSMSKYIHAKFGKSSNGLNYYLLQFSMDAKWTISDEKVIGIETSRMKYFSVYGHRRRRSHGIRDYGVKQMRVNSSPWLDLGCNNSLMP